MVSGVGRLMAQGVGFKGLRSELRVKDSGFGRVRVQGLSFRVQDSGFRFWCSAIIVRGSGFRVQDLEFRIQSLFRVQSSGCEFLG